METPRPELTPQYLLDQLRQQTETDRQKVFRKLMEATRAIQTKNPQKTVGGEEIQG